MFPPTATTDDDTRKTITDDIAQSAALREQGRAVGHGRRQRRRPRADDVDPRQGDQLRGRQSRRGDDAAREFGNSPGPTAHGRRSGGRAGFDRVLVHRDELRKWTWLWDAKLGGVEVKGRSTLSYENAPAQREEAPGTVPVLKKTISSPRRHGVHGENKRTNQSSHR